MARVLIVGVGNPLRSDDGLGWHVAQELSRELLENTRVIATQQLTPEISEMASHAEVVLFVDAAQSGEPGTLKCNQVVPASAYGRHSHDLSPATVLKLAEELYGRCPRGYVITVAAQSFADGDTLSPPVKAALPGLKTRIRELIDRGGE